MISIRDLTVAFGGVRALNSVSVNLTAGVSGIIGPNGAGKTTLINVLSGFVTPLAGSISIDGTEILELRPHQRARLGLRRSFQREQVVDELTVEDNIRVVLDPIGPGGAEGRRLVREAAAFCGIEQQLHQRAGGLNACQRRMTEIARCLVGSAKVVMLDEPGASLSQVEVDDLRRVISGIHGFSGAQVLLIDHDVELIQAVCEKTMVLDFGSLIAEGETADVLVDPRVRAVYLGMEDA